MVAAVIETITHHLIPNRQPVIGCLALLIESPDFGTMFRTGQDSFPPVLHFRQLNQYVLWFQSTAVAEVNVGDSGNSMACYFLIETVGHVGLILGLLDEGVPQTVEVFVVNISRKKYLFLSIKPA